MKKYVSFFRLRFTMGLQYRAAALAGVVTQFAWGGLTVLMFRAFYEADAAAFPMSLQATASYIWLQQAFLALFMAWFLENEIFEAIRNGSVAYELCRPIELYNMWFARSVANRLSRAVLRCMPILLVASFLPAPYGLSLPPDLPAFFWFLLTTVLGLLTTVAFCMLVYIITFFTVSPAGIRMVAVSLVEFFAGGIIPLPFFPSSLRRVLELLPFGSMENVPLRVYSGDISGDGVFIAAALQVFWIAVMVLGGKLLTRKAMKKVVIQGG